MKTTTRPCALPCAFTSISRIHGIHSPVVTPISRHYTRNSQICASQTSEPETDKQIENLNTNYCDDFVCTSSPAIESTVRALARDLERCNGVYTSSLLSRNVEYKDTFRSFKGVDGYRRLNFITKKMQQPSLTVQKLQMLDTGVAEIQWTLKGNIGPQAVTILGTTEISMNLLTGQIEKHTERWNLSKCSPPAAAAFMLTRLLWSLQSRGADAAEATSSVLDSLTSMDEGDAMSGYEQNPNDPMKYFQQKDSFKDDAIFFLGGMALLYAVWQAYKNILSM